MLLNKASINNEVIVMGIIFISIILLLLTLITFVTRYCLKVFQDCYTHISDNITRYRT